MLKDNRVKGQDWDYCGNANLRYLMDSTLLAANMVGVALNG
jgi:hypothetical protein